MLTGDVYDLPVLLGEQYMLSALLRETRDVILYRATQKDLRREVVVECLRPSAAADEAKLHAFLETARARACFEGLHLARVLEVLQADGAWLVARESPEGEPLDMLLAAGERLRGEEVCLLMQMLCRLCLRLDAERLNSVVFQLGDIFYRERRFSLNNPACAGARPESATRDYLADAAQALLPLVEPGEALAGQLVELLQRTCIRRAPSPTLAAFLLAEYAALYALMLREGVPA